MERDKSVHRARTMTCARCLSRLHAGGFGQNRWEVQSRLSWSHMDVSPQLTLPPKVTLPETANSHVDFMQATCKHGDERGGTPLSSPSPFRWGVPCMSASQRCTKSCPTVLYGLDIVKAHVHWLNYTSRKGALHLLIGTFCTLS